MTDIAALASRALTDPASLSLDEIQSLAGSRLALEPEAQAQAEAAEVDGLKAERADLIRKADKRRDEPGYAQNVADIEARIAEIDGLVPVEQAA